MLSAQAVKYDIPVSMQSFPWFSRRRPWVYAESIWHLVRTIQENDIALVHTNCDRSLRHTMWACWLARIPYVSHARDCVRGWFQPENLAALNRAKRVIANSKAVANAFVEAGVSDKLVEVIYNPVDVARFSQAKPEAGIALRSSLGIPLDAFVVGLVGQIQPIKGHEGFIAAAAYVARAVRDAKFLIVGADFGTVSQVFLQRLKQSVAESDLSAHVCFTGFRDDIPAVMQALDVLVVPSWSEPSGCIVEEEDVVDIAAKRHSPRLLQVGFGRVVIEGMAAGRAVVATHLDGMLEVLEHKCNGLLVPPRDVRALADAMILLAEDTELRNRLGEGGRRTAERFAVIRHVAQVQALYDVVLGV